VNVKRPQEDTPTTEFNILQNVLSKANRKICRIEMNIKMGQRPRRKGSFLKKRRGNLSKVLRIWSANQLEPLVPDLEFLETPGSNPEKTSGPSMVRATIHI